MERGLRPNTTVILDQLSASEAPIQGLTREPDISRAKRDTILFACQVLSGSSPRCRSDRYAGFRIGGSRTLTLSGMTERMPRDHTTTAVPGTGTCTVPAFAPMAETNASAVASMIGNEP